MALSKERNVEGFLIDRGRVPLTRFGCQRCPVAVSPVAGDISDRDLAFCMEAGCDKTCWRTLQQKVETNGLRSAFAVGGE
jgi:hypothetical protein